MKLFEQMPGLQGCFLLTPNGSIGKYENDGRFVRDETVERAMERAVAGFLQHYRQTGDTEGYRIGIVHTDHTDKPWNSLTVALDDKVLRRLYSVNEPGGKGLTMFQRRNREKSLYRGMELLLNYRDSALPGTPYFCPILVYRGTTLNQYLPWMERTARESDSTTPVVEIINLIPGCAQLRGNDTVLAEYIEAQQRLLVRPELRSELNLVVIDDVRQSSYAWKETPMPADPYVGEDESVVKEIANRFGATRFHDWDYAYWVDRHSSGTVRARLGQQLRAMREQRHSGFEALRRFERFEQGDAVALKLLSAKNPVFSFAPETPLLDLGSQDAWNLYLLDGELQLTAADGQVSILRAGTPSARRPVAFLKPRLYAVSASTPVEFLWLYEPMVEAVLRLYPKRANALAMPSRNTA